MEKFAARASLTGIKELYLIILALSVTEALVNIPPADCSFHFFSYVILLMGFLSTVFRFVLESMILLEHINVHMSAYWSKETFFTVILCLMSGICLYLMGHHLITFDQFIIYTILLLVVDLLLLVISHKPWNKGGLSFFIKKSISILTWHKLYAAFAPRAGEDLPEDRAHIKRTHYQWGRSNIFLSIFLLIILAQWYHDFIEGACPLTTPLTADEFFFWVFYLPQRLWLFQWLAAIVLLLFALWDVTVNYTYYFGKPPSREI